MYIVTVFGTTGLSATINIYDLSDDSLAVEGAAMSEVASTGVYKYNFSGYDASKDYMYRIDGGAALGTQRYKYGTNNSNLDSIKSTVDTNLDAKVSDCSTLGTGATTILLQQDRAHVILVQYAFNYIKSLCLEKVSRPDDLWHHVIYTDQLTFRGAPCNQFLPTSHTID